MSIVQQTYAFYCFLFPRLPLGVSKWKYLWQDTLLIYHYVAIYVGWVAKEKERTVWNSKRNLLGTNNLTFFTFNENQQCDLFETCFVVINGTCYLQILLVKPFLIANKGASKRIVDHNRGRGSDWLKRLRTEKTSTHPTESKRILNKLYTQLLLPPTWYCINVITLLFSTQLQCSPGISALRKLSESRGPIFTSFYTLGLAYTDIPICQLASCVSKYGIIFGMILYLTCTGIIFSRIHIFTQLAVTRHYAGLAPRGVLTPNHYLINTFNL